MAIRQLTSVRIEIEVDTKHGVYRDALYCAPEDLPKPEEVEKLAQERADNWVAIIDAPPVEPTEEDYAAQLASIEEQRAQLDAQVETTATAIAAIQAAKAITIKPKG